MKAAEKLLEQLKTIDKVEECHIISAKNKFFIKDESGTAVLKDTCIDFKLCFSIVNALLQTIHFIPIDGDGVIGDKMKCCEAVIFNDEYFSFLELKLNATSTARRAVHENRTEAVKQIESTIGFFDEKLSKNYEGLTLEAIIATPNFYPRANTSWQNIETKFVEQNRIPLFETTEKEY